MTARMSLQQLMHTAESISPAFHSGLAAEIVVNSGRQHGPLDGKCEVCGKPDAGGRYTLQDWLHWHCEPCSITAFLADTTAR